MLARAERIVSAADYRRVVRRGRRSSSPLMTVYAVAGTDTGPSRFGFIVAKTVGNAVVRNRVRRRLKAICYSLQSTRGSDRAAVDIVFRAHPAAAVAPFSDLERDAVTLVDRSSVPGAPVSQGSRR